MRALTLLVHAGTCAAFVAVRGITVRPLPRHFRVVVRPPDGRDLTSSILRVEIVVVTILVAKYVYFKDFSRSCLFVFEITDI